MTLVLRVTLRDHGGDPLQTPKTHGSEDGEGNAIKQLSESENGITLM